MEATPPNSRSNVNFKPLRHLIAKEAIDLFQSLVDEKARLIWTLKVTNLDVDLSQNLILRMSWLCPKLDLSLQRNNKFYAT